MPRIYDNFESVALTATAAAYGIASEADYQRFLAECDTLQVDDVSVVYQALGDWALAHERLEEAHRAYRTGLARCYDEGDDPHAAFGLMRRLADLQDSDAMDGNGDALREEWLARHESFAGADDLSHAIFLANEAAACAWHGRNSLAQTLLIRLVPLVRTRRARKRREIANLLRGLPSAAARRKALHYSLTPPVRFAPLRGARAVVEHQYALHSSTGDRSHMTDEAVPLTESQLNDVAGGGINPPTPIVPATVNPTVISPSTINPTVIGTGTINPTVIGVDSINPTVIQNATINPIVIP